MGFEHDATKASYLLYCGVAVADSHEKDGLYAVFPIVSILRDVPQAESDNLEMAMEKFTQNCLADEEAMRRLNTLLGKPHK